ncbi:MAG: hypothetical protein V1913_13325 [Fibrobacterota bacterium]
MMEQAQWAKDPARDAVWVKGKDVAACKAHYPPVPGETAHVLNAVIRNLISPDNPAIRRSVRAAG